MSAKTGVLDVICKKSSFSHSNKAATICVLDPGLGNFPGASQCRAGIRARLDDTRTTHTGPLYAFHSFLVTEKDSTRQVKGP